MSTSNRNRTVVRSRPGRGWLVAIAALVLAITTSPNPSHAQEGRRAPPTGDATESSEGGTGEDGNRGSATLTWSVQPTPTSEAPERPNFSFDLEGGDTIEDSIRVRNFGERPLQLDVYASDAITTSSGALDLLPAGEDPSAVGAWIELASDDVEVPPGETVDIPFTMDVPDNAEPGDHTGGIVTSYRAATDNGQDEPVVLDRRLGSRVHVRVDGALRPTLSIQDVNVSYDGSLNPFATGTATVTYTVVNTGNIRLAADQHLLIPGRFGFPGRERRPAALPELLPDNSLSFQVEVRGVWPTFRTTGLVQLTALPVRDGDTFDEATFTASATTTSMPWGQLALLAVVVAVVGWWIWSRRRRTTREARIRAEARELALRERETTDSDAPASPQRPSTKPEPTTTS